MDSAMASPKEGGTRARERLRGEGLAGILTHHDSADWIKGTCPQAVEGQKKLIRITHGISWFDLRDVVSSRFRRLQRLKEDRPAPRNSFRAQGLADQRSQLECSSQRSEKLLQAQAPFPPCLAESVCSVASSSLA